MLRSEIPRGMCAKLRTAAASNNRDHPTRSLYYCLFAPRIDIFVLRAHPVRGESHNQRNATREVATTSPPFYNEPHRSHALLCEGWTQHNLHILVTAPFCCDRKSRAACAQSFALRQQATIEITQRDHSIIACSHHAYIFLFFAHIPFVVNHTINATPPERLQQYHTLKRYTTVAMVSAANCTAVGSFQPLR